MSDKPLEQRLEEKELAQRLNVSLGTRRTCRADGKHVRFHQIRQMISHARSDAQDWLVSRLVGGDAAKVAR